MAWIRENILGRQSTAVSTCAKFMGLSGNKQPHLLYDYFSFPYSSSDTGLLIYNEN